MTTNATTADTYRRAVVALSLLSGLAMAALITVGYPLVGVGAFAVLIVAAVAVSSRAGRTMYDERTEQQHNRAAGRTLTVFGWGSAVFFPAMTALVALEYATWPPWLVGIALFVPALYGTYGLFVAVEKFA